MVKFNPKGAEILSEGWYLKGSELYVDVEFKDAAGRQTTETYSETEWDSLNQ